MEPVGLNLEKVARWFKPEQIETIRLRLPICAPCTENDRLTELVVHCKACGCGAVSLLHGSCKLNKWPAANQLNSP